ncbi:unnamed protein product [Mycena citricolor]|uniref:Protein kinase domain-containing protein n=1 Tax=Mycena citricolor TaxID=2018698 RepID=A0AAD2HJZ8_9AGAR|nr:unnamed protein product [Mycena citricolor]
MSRPIRRPGNLVSASVSSAVLRTKRTPEGCLWGHSLDDFFIAKSDQSEGYSWSDVWNTSLFEELGVSERSDDAHCMKICAPWPMADAERSRILNEEGSYFDTARFPKLEERIPHSHLPNLLHVHDPDARVGQNQGVLVYKRLLPEVGKEQNPGHLYLTRSSRVGCGHHSNVYHAVFQFDSTAVRVVAKVSVARTEARGFLDHEACLYASPASFPESLSDAYSGYALVPGIKYPVPVGAVVPKFYGFYVPETGYSVDDATQPSPIMLLEDCGTPIEPQSLSHDEKAECFSLFLRLHMSGILQRSPFRKNILVQPGPLTLPPAERSLTTPSFRVIDFGRALDRSQARHQRDWLDERDQEVRDVQKVLKIERHSMA